MRPGPFPIRTIIRETARTGNQKGRRRTPARTRSSRDRSPPERLRGRLAGAGPARPPPPDRGDADRVSRRDAEGRRDAEKNAGRGAGPAARRGPAGIQGPESVGSASLRPSASLRETLHPIRRRPTDRPVPLATRPAWIRPRRSFDVPGRDIDRPSSYCANMNNTV